MDIKYFSFCSFICSVFSGALKNMSHTMASSIMMGESTVVPAATHDRPQVAGIPIT